MTAWHGIVTKELLQERFTYKDGFLLKGHSKVGIYKDKDGYGKLTIKVSGKNYYLRTHRAIFLYHHGTLPDIIDHINGDVSDNRIENLRAATKSQNQWNRKNNIKSKTGRRGVVLKNNKYYAVCKVNGKRYHLGSFTTLEEAEKEVTAFRKENHKEFANND